MHIVKSERGFEFLQHPEYVPPWADKRLASQSSAVGDYDDARPGTSFLWIGDDHHLNREEVSQLVRHLLAWLATGSLAITEDQ